MKHLRLGVEYGASPIFNGNVEQMGHIELAELGISSLLMARISEWDAAFQRTFSEMYPPDSGFESEELRKSHDALGGELAALLQSELDGAAVVTFCPAK